MAWLTVPEDAATAELEQLTLPWRKRGEQVPPVMGVLKLNPTAFAAVLGLNYAVAFGASSLGRRREELREKFLKKHSGDWSYSLSCDPVYNKAHAEKLMPWGSVVKAFFTELKDC